MTRGRITAVINFIRNHYPKKRTLLLETLILVLGPILVTYLVPNFILFRHVLLIFGVIYLLLIIKIFGFQLPHIGFTATNLSPSLKAIIKPTLIIWSVFLVIIIKYADFLSLKEASLGPFVPTNLRLVLYILISVPLQEMIFRGFIIKRLSLISQNSLFITLYSSLIFSLAHLMFSNYWIALSSFVFSVWWTIQYLRYRNLWPIIFSHAILGSIVLLATFT